MNSNIMTKVFLWMFIGLAVTFATGSVIANNPDMITNVFQGGSIIVLAIVELVLVIVLSARITKMKPTTAKFLFILYSFITGLTFSSIFVVYNISSIIYVFLATSLIMLAMAAAGNFMKADLTKIGTILFVGLIGVILATIVNIFIGSSELMFAATIISIIVFVIYVAYDVQKIKQLEDIIPEENLAIYGALQLYLDFINIFIDLLRLFGDNN